jgi:RNA polymerase sigma-70 factor (ECF subfamily)
MASSVIADLLGHAYPESGTPAAVAEDHRLIAGLQAGVERDYELLIERFQQPVYNLALRLISDAGDAGDIVQEVFLKIFRNVHTFRGQSSLRTWIYRIAVNEAHNRRRWVFRHKHNEVCLEASDASGTLRECNVPDGDPSPFDRALTHQNHALIVEALTRINPCFREAVVLRDIEDLSYDEIAEILNISIGTVKSRITRGRDALRQQLSLVLHPGVHQPRINHRLNHRANPLGLGGHS